MKIQDLNCHDRYNQQEEISKEETYKKISDILSNGKYMDLINEFDRLFS